MRMTSSLNEGGTAVFRPLSSGLVFLRGIVMKTYLVKQKFRFGGEKFDIKDDRGNIDYQVEGSFLKIPKTFTIYDDKGEVVSQIQKTVLTVLPQFEIQLRNGSSFYIRKKLTFLRDKYEFDNLGLRIEGNIWDLEFRLLDAQGQVIAEISKELLHLMSTYQVVIYEDAYADLVISLCVAIDYVEALESSS
ncbi:LURP-one-related family protein [Streptococcus anginosus]|uniref:LURP-one-related family protein n=2 Tax=Streptococcus TaxID=1301 RepID=A0AAU7PYJ9_9STRE|nr:MULTISPECIES: LURP-one-related family protein [Streptococcus]MBC5618803.1 LURP-one-related family protein [Streptococcus hominis]MCW0924063.1 LURP-one-related family protein [Streptococcus anginosus]